jgi:hypothetical protein
MLGKIVAPAIVTVLLLVLATDVFAMGGGNRRRRGGGGDNGNGGEGARPTLTDAQVAQLQHDMDQSGGTEGDSRPGTGQFVGGAGGASGDVIHNPEPGSMLLLASGAAGLVGWRWRRSRATR